MIHIKKSYTYTFSLSLSNAYKRDTFLIGFIIERNAKFEYLLENIAKNTV